MLPLSFSKTVPFRAVPLSQVDGQFSLDPKLGENQHTSEKLVKYGLSPVTFTELAEVVDILKVWRDPVVGPG